MVLCHVRVPTLSFRSILDSGGAPAIYCAGLSAGVSTLPEKQRDPNRIGDDQEFQDVDTRRLANGSFARRSRCDFISRKGKREICDAASATGVGWPAIQDRARLRLD